MVGLGKKYPIESVWVLTASGCTVNQKPESGNTPNRSVGGTNAKMSCFLCSMVSSATGGNKPRWVGLTAGSISGATPQWTITPSPCSYGGWYPPSAAAPSPYSRFSSSLL